MKSLTRIVNPVGALKGLATKLGTRRYIRTCRTENCGCVSHDPGYWEADVRGASVEIQNYIEPRLREADSDVHGWGVSELEIPTVGTRVRGLRAAEDCRQIMSLRFLSEVEKGQYCAKVATGDRDAAWGAYCTSTEREQAHAARIIASRREFASRPLTSMAGAFAAVGL